MSEKRQSGDAAPIVFVVASNVMETVPSASVFSPV